jgi:hypothetical protein
MAVKLLGVSGSIRPGSHNGAALVEFTRRLEGTKA